MEIRNQQRSDEAWAVISEAHTLGIRLVVDQGRLFYRTREAVPLDFHRRLQVHKPEVVALLSETNHTVAWRVAAIRPQVPVRGPIPFLIARQASKSLGEPPWCLSCGDALGEGRTVRCVPCVLAIEHVLNEAREGMGSGRS